MSKYSALIKRASNATAALALTVASLTPAMMLGSSAKAAQITARSITMSNSKPNTSADWLVDLGTTWNLTTISVAVCDSPLFDVTCYNPDDNGVTNGDLTARDGSPAAVTYTSKTEGTAFTATNPRMVGTFYARITSGSDTGSVALSTTNDLTINARVQEQLAFCVGSIDDSAITGTNTAEAANNDINNCTNSTFSSAGVVDLGVVGSGAVSTSPVNSTTYSGNDDTGVFMIQTNAISGAVVSYTSAGRLKIGSECADDDSLVDQCFNSASNYTDWTAEKFGMTVKGIYKGSSKTGDGTSNLGAATAYNGTNYSWNNSSSSAVTVASSNTVLDWEFATLEFKARAAATTPTGSYTTSANFVATATF